MRRRVVIGAGISTAVIVGIGLLIWMSQHGYIGPYGTARQLLAQAKHAITQEQFPEAQARLEELIGTFPSSPWTDDGLVELGGVYEAQQQRLEAGNMYRLLLERFPSSPHAGTAQARLGQVNIALLFSPVITEFDTVHEVQPGDTLGEIASANRTTVAFLKRANGITGDTIYPRQKLKVPSGRFEILVDKSQNKLLLTENGQFIRTYAVATGTKNSTPVGTFTIVNKIIDPIWYRQGAVVPPDSPENILGSRWMGISEQGYGIHGSVDPEAIGRQVTAGCVRMTNAEVEELFTIVPIGTEVTIVN